MSALAARRHVIVSIQDVSYIDMAGFHVLESARDRAIVGQRVALIGSPPNVKRVIRILQFDTVVSVFEDEEAALAFVRAGRSSADTS
jgi:anti-anti-sigma factor